MNLIFFETLMIIASLLSVKGDVTLNQLFGALTEELTENFTKNSVDNSNSLACIKSKLNLELNGNVECKEPSGAFLILTVATVCLNENAFYEKAFHKEMELFRRNEFKDNLDCVKQNLMRIKPFSFLLNFHFNKTRCDVLPSVYDEIKNNRHPLAVVSKQFLNFKSCDDSKNVNELISHGYEKVIAANENKSAEILNLFMEVYIQKSKNNWTDGIRCVMNELRRKI
jgi:hypothetical protein